MGIYVGNNMMIHCGNPIQYTSISSSYWQEHPMLMGALALAGVFAAALFYKVVKGRKEGEDSEAEDLEFYDGGAYINEDGESGSGNGEER